MEVTAHNSPITAQPESSSISNHADQPARRRRGGGGSSRGGDVSMDERDHSMNGANNDGAMDDTEAEAEHKRSQARERQRRKRARDRAGIPPPPRGDDVVLDEKKDKIRKAARERQRKHRAIARAKRAQAIEEVFAQPLEGEQPGVSHHVIYDVPPGSSGHVIPTGHPPPPPSAGPGQIFANTLLLALACAPMLKMHLMRTFSIAQEDMPSLEHTLADAFDHWNHERYNPPSYPSRPPGASSPRTETPQPHHPPHHPPYGPQQHPTSSPDSDSQPGPYRSQQQQARSSNSHSHSHSYRPVNIAPSTSSHLSTYRSPFALVPATMTHAPAPAPPVPGTELSRSPPSTSSHSHNTLQPPPQNQRSAYESDERVDKSAMAGEIPPQHQQQDYARNWEALNAARGQAEDYVKGLDRNQNQMHGGHGSQS